MQAIAVKRHPLNASLCLFSRCLCKSDRTTLPVYLTAADNSSANSPVTLRLGWHAAIVVNYMLHAHRLNLKLELGDAAINCNFSSQEGASRSWGSRGLCIFRTKNNVKTVTITTRVLGIELKYVQLRQLGLRTFVGSCFQPFLAVISAYLGT